MEGLQDFCSLYTPCLPFSQHKCTLSNFFGTNQEFNNFLQLLIKINFLEHYISTFPGTILITSQMSEQYEVQKILGKRIRNGKAEYKIKWLNYSEQDCTWEPESNLTTCRQMLKKYNQNLSKVAETDKPQQAPKPKLVPSKIPNKFINGNEEKSKGEKPKKKAKQDDSAEEEYNEVEEFQEDTKYKRSLPSGFKQGPPLKKAIRNQNARNQSSEQPVQENQTNEEEGQIKQVKGARPSKSGEGRSQSLQVLGMFQKDKAYCFKIRENSRVSFLSRDELLLKDPISLVQFYEKNMHVIPSKN